MTSAAIHTAKGNPPNVGLGWRMDSPKPEPGYYALLPLTVPFDIATCPIQAIYWAATSSPTTTNNIAQTKKH